eukprot:10061581-Alexandrium_andersonii.AAC.1
MFCNASRDELYQASGLSPLGCSWHVNQNPEYEAACARCEVKVSLSATAHALLLPLLRFDKRPSGNKG